MKALDWDEVLGEGAIDIAKITRNRFQVQEGTEE